MNTPILLLIFNRPDTAQRVFEAIRQAQPRRLFVAADGPRKDRSDDIEKCAKTRAIIDQVDWECEVKTLFRDENLGAGRGISCAITWFFEHVEHGIIMEDDSLPHPSFFNYCSSLLELYKMNHRVWSISGPNFYPNPELPTSYYFSGIAHGWGWATWKDRWDKYVFDYKNISLRQLNAACKSYFPNRRHRYYCLWINCFMKITRYEGTWDYQLGAAMNLNNGLCIIPKINLISNIGFGSDSTHTTNPDDPKANVPTDSIGTLVHPAEVKQNVEADEYQLNQRNWQISGFTLLARCIYLFIKVRIFHMPYK